jgi:hypothetical protein
MWFTHLLGYFHNNWILYYSSCNHLRFVHCTYNRYIMISFPILTSVSIVQVSLCKSLPKPSYIDSLSLILIIFSHPPPRSSYSSQPITFLYIEFMVQNPTCLSQNHMTTHDDSLQLMTTYCSGMIFLPLPLHVVFTFPTGVLPAFVHLYAFTCLTFVPPTFARTLKT